MHGHMTKVLLVGNGDTTAAIADPTARAADDTVQWTRIEAGSFTKVVETARAKKLWRWILIISLWYCGK